MPKTTKKQSKRPKITLIEQLEKERKSRVMLYFTGEKQPIQQFGTQIAVDVLPLFKKILEKFDPNTNKVSLVINTSGGHLEAPWPLVNLIREYCKFFEVIILEKALSAGTMIALGADKIVMMPYSQLSPIDPAANIVDNEKKQVKKVEIEDIIGYIDFAKDKIGIAEQSALAEIMKELTKEVGPTMLGSINRTHSLIRKLSKNLLHLHGRHLPEKQVREITENLTQKLYSHTHLINRKEAKEEVGFNNIIEFANPKIKKLADKLFDECVKLLELNEPFDPVKTLGQSAKKEFTLSRAIVHSADLKFNFQSKYQIIKSPDPSGAQQIIINRLSDEWLLSK